MILGLIEHDQGELNNVSLEMLALARDLASQSGRSLAAAIIGAEAAPLAGDLAEYGVEVVYLAQHERLDDYAPAAWARTLEQLTATESPAAVLAAGSERGQEVMAHLAARLDLPLAANCVSASPGDSYDVTRVRWGGSLLEEARLAGEPKLLTVALHALAAAPALLATTPDLRHFTPELDDHDFRVRVVAREAPAGDQVVLTDAHVVVGGGRGVGSREGFESLEELAALLGGAVGCSRAVTNHGWRPHADQIGQTGARVAPDLYIACGISGAIQHMVGCSGAKHILAINTDPEAPILARADYAIIGDLHEVVPAISEAIRALNS